MPYDDALAARIRRLLADERDLREQRMFGGIAFLVGGSIAVAASGQGGLLVRAEPSAAAPPGARPFTMRGRELRGWLRVDEVGADAELARWVELGRAAAQRTADTTATTATAGTVAPTTSSRVSAGRTS